MDIIKKYQDIIVRRLDNIYSDYEPLVSSLYSPARYAVQGGKKLRPVLTLMAADAFASKAEQAIPAALAIEMFHNFTLVHDDVMDASPIRRGQPTVYHKWNTNQAILTGDAMLLLAFRYIHLYDNELQSPLLEQLTWVGLRVSEGQQLDMEFETKTTISLQEYLQMIELKTAVLIGTALKMGAIVAGASQNDQYQIYQFGKNLGIAFQIQDDYMDLYADQKVFGKKIGNDIITNKKTFLLIKALEISDNQQKNELLNLFSNKSINPQDKIKQVKNIYEKLHIKQIVNEEIENMYKKSKQNLQNITGLNAQWKETFSNFADWLMKRKK